MLNSKFIYARITLFDKAWYIRDLPRLLEGVNYVARAKQVGVPEKHINRIRRRFSPWSYFMRKYAQAVINDIKRR